MDANEAKRLNTNSIGLIDLNECYAIFAFKLIVQSFHNNNFYTILQTHMQFLSDLLDGCGCSSLRNTGSVEIEHKTTTLLFVLTHSRPVCLSSILSSVTSGNRILFYYRGFAFYSSLSALTLTGLQFIRVSLAMNVCSYDRSISWFAFIFVNEQTEKVAQIHYTLVRRAAGVPKPLNVFEHTCEDAGKFITVKHKTAQTINFLFG